MSSPKGVIALMGSGELTSSMVDVHRTLIDNLSAPLRAVFLDTPAGFQLNVDQLSKRACDYFRVHVQASMTTASFKSSESDTPFETEKALQNLRQANYILIGPGSPTYAVKQWRGTPVPDILDERIQAGARLVAASAAALTVGRFTLPVYEIYKVGEDLHWVDGVDLLGRFGFKLVVIPHWNNAEGGTHDTRFCYMGEPRFKRLEALLPREVSILGLDEHTACLIDLEKGEALVRGIGRVTLRFRGGGRTFEKGDRIPLEVLRGALAVRGREERAVEPGDSLPGSKTDGWSFWESVHSIQQTFHTGLEKGDFKESTNAVLALDEAIWRASQDLENQEFISQAREILRELVVLLGLKLESTPKDRRKLLSPLVESLLEMRQECRRKKRWDEADRIREQLRQAGVQVEDTESGVRWRLRSGGPGA